jgi:histidine ammonia-lyase
MLLQYAAASLVSENKVLVHPASADSIPTSANQEDHVSMGSIAARQARDVLRNAEHVLALELLCAGQGLDFRVDHIGAAGLGAGEAHRRLRERVAHLATDRDPGPDIQAALEIVREGRLLDLLPD